MYALPGVVDCRRIRRWRLTMWNHAELICHVSVLPAGMCAYQHALHDPLSFMPVRHASCPVLPAVPAAK